MVESFDLSTDFTLPELGENIASGDVLRVLVKPGDTLAKDQPVLELETDKATIEVPSSVAGQVKDVKVKVGDKVKVGQAILSVDGGASSAAAPTAAAPAAAAPAPAAGSVESGRSGKSGERVRAPPRHRRRRRLRKKRTRDPSSPPRQKVVDINRGARQAAEVRGTRFPGRSGVAVSSAHGA